MKKTWGGRFQKSTDPQVEAFTESISFDHRLGSFDIKGSLAHVQTLVRAKLLTASDGKNSLGLTAGSKASKNKGNFPSIEAWKIYIPSLKRP